MIAAAQATERLVLRSAGQELDLNRGPIRLAPEGPDWGEATMEQVLADAERGSLPVDQRLPNRPIGIPLILGADGPDHFRAARAALQSVVADIQTEGGVLWRWHPNYPGLSCDLVGASLKLPERWSHYGAEADVILTLTAIPDFYGEETQRYVSVSAGTDLLVVENDVLGDYPSRVRIVIEDQEGQAKDGLLWAIRARHYDPDPTARLIWRAAELDVIPPAAVQVPSVEVAVVQRAGVGQTWAAVLNWQTPEHRRPTHQGSYRVWARAQSSAPGARLRLLWGIGDLSAATTNTPAPVPTAGAWHMLDLGELRLDALPVGHHHWLGQIQARADAGAVTLQLDRLYLQPLELGGRLWVPADREPDTIIPAFGITELRTDGMLRQEQNPGADRPGYQPVSHVIGDLPRLFPGTNEILLRASRGDFETRPDPDLDGPFTATILYQPSYLNPTPPLLLTTPVVISPHAGEVTPEQLPLLTGIGSPVLVVELQIDNRPPITVTVASDRSWSHQIPDEQWLTFGEHTLRARQTDLLGNLSATVTVTWMIKIEGWDWDAVMDAAESWDELLDKYATWDDLARNVRSGG